MSSSQPYSDSSSKYLQESNPGGYIFALIVFAYQIALCLLFGFYAAYQTEKMNQYQPGDLLFLSILSLLCVIGFGLINSYITNSAFSGISMSLLIFAITFQHYFLFRTFWYKVGVYDENTVSSFDQDKIYRTITYVNNDQDLQNSYDLPVTSATDAIACSLSIMVAFSSLVGRIGLIETFILTLFGTIFYQLNSQLLWRFYITDTGYGMRVFLYGSVIGIVSSCILGKKQTTVDHLRYFSQYSTQSFGLIGLVFIFCALPFLTLGGLYKTSTGDTAIMWMAALNMWLCLCGSILGYFSSTSIQRGKLKLHDLIFSGLGGAIVYSSSVDLHRNPAVPLTVGFVASFLLTLLYTFHSQHRLNQNGVLFSLSIINRFFIPGVLCAILSAILHAVDQINIFAYIYKQVTITVGNDSNNTTTTTSQYYTFDQLYTDNRQDARCATEQGGFQLIGLLLCLGIPLVVGIIIGLLMKCINGYNRVQQFNDNQVFIMEYTGKRFIYTTESDAS